MTPFNSVHLIYALAVTFLLHGLVTSGHAQGYPTYGQNSRGFGNSHEFWNIQTSQDIKKNIYLIDNLADQMLYRFVGDSKQTSQSEAEEALLKQMKRHAELTNELIHAYRGKSDASFKKAAFEVTQSTKKLIELKRNANISEAVNYMINQSLPLITFVCDHASQHRISAKT
jgi:hypothetical protein